MLSMVRVFIAEDQELVRLGLKAALPRAGPIEIVGEADNGADAIAQVIEQQPSVVLVDIDLPGKNGIETTRCIKQQLPDTRVVIFTGHTDDERLFDAIEAGADAYVVKSSDMENLVLAIRAVLSGAVWLDPLVAVKVMKASASGYMRGGGQGGDGEQRDLLSEREKEIVKLIAAGMSNQSIAKKLYLSVDTIKTHIRHIMEKMDVNNRTEAVVKAMKMGLFV
jgi:DNA-binding NarL/FixJ family response regulator